MVTKSIQNSSVLVWIVFCSGIAMLVSVGYSAQISEVFNVSGFIALKIETVKTPETLTIQSTSIQIYSEKESNVLVTT